MSAFISLHGQRIEDQADTANMDLPLPLPVDGELVAAATESVQAHERLNRTMRTKLKEQPHSKQALSSVASVYSKLRVIKSRLEGSYFSFSPVSLKVSSKGLTELKHLTLSHTPSTLHEATKVKMAEKLAELFGGQVKKLVYACLLTCPVFAQAQTEISAQSRNNLLYVVFVSSDEQFFSLATPHERQFFETVDKGFLFATEVCHFCSQLQQGNVRAVEALCAPPDSFILCSQEWAAIAGLLDPVSLLQKSFIEKCIGQAVGGLIKKNKVKGQQVLRDDASLTKFCDAFRLLSYVELAQRREAVCPWPGQVDGGGDDSSPSKREMVKLLYQGFEEGIVQKEHLLRCVMEWRERLKEGTEGAKEGQGAAVMELPRCGPGWTRELEQWLATVRLDGLQLSTKSALAPSDREKLTTFLVTRGVTSVNPDNILAIAKSGSHMYGLATPTSDTNYIIVFREPTESIISSYRPRKEALHNRGQQKDEEIVAYEARKFLEILLKGAVNIVEMVFSETGDLFYASEEWKALTAHRELFMTEQVILQYIGFVNTHMNIIRKRTHAGKPKEGKIFYHIYHKLLSLERFVEGHSPLIKCSGQERESILRIRAGPLKGDLEPSLLLSAAERRLDSVYDRLPSRKVRLREVGDYRTLQTWLLHVRGVGLTKPLRLATPPPTLDI